ncbi:MAG: DUF2190 family protein [Anaerolineae bacterium]|nr:DUF2190 family protein [Anaerolineae bacterium]MCP5428531.1 DUF2190 family protein [Chromatiaceae bacterium]
MSGRNEGLIKSFVPGAAIAPYRCVKHDTTDNSVVQGAAATNPLIGVSNSLGAAANDDTVDVVFSGIAEVEYGGNVTRGDLLTSDANGKAIATTTAGNRIIGIAMASGVSGDIGLALINPGSV